MKKLLTLICWLVASQQMIAQTVTVEAESLTPAGTYAGKITQPFGGMAFYGNGDCATKTVTFPVKNGMYTVGVRGASSATSPSTSPKPTRNMPTARCCWAMRQRLR